MTTAARSVPDALHPLACAHCGLPVQGEAFREGELAFCCAGCQAARAIVRGLGFEKFYELRRAAAGSDLRVLRPERSDLDAAAYVRALGKGRLALDAMIDGLACAACVWLIERALRCMPNLIQARVDLGAQRLHLEWRGTEADAQALVAVVEELGYRIVPFDAERLAEAEDQSGKRLLRALGVAGFASANVMMFSFAFWADAQMGPHTRDLLHWASALVALPACLYAGRIFFVSAWKSLRAGFANMDLPISVGVLLTLASSLVDTIRGAPHVYFDGATMLLFFLLVGRYLEHRARGRARSGVRALLALRSRAVTLLTPGGCEARPPERVQPGARVLVAAGERFGVDGVIEEGSSSVDASLVTGEVTPGAIAPGSAVYAGTTNLDQPVVVRVTRAADDTLLAEIARLVAGAESRRGRIVALADRVGRIYAPVVHLLAFWTFAIAAIAGLDLHDALSRAVAVLLVTCPCALGLAVPAVQIVAAGALLKRGVLMKSATGLERLAEIDTVVFDKTGTLTLGRPNLVASAAIDVARFAQAASLAASSRHPLACALVRAAAARGIGVTPVAGAVEHKGSGMIGPDGARLGSRVFCDVDLAVPVDGPELWFRAAGAGPVRFVFEDAVRVDARATLARLRELGLGLAIRSGDRAPLVARLAETLHVSDRVAQCTPADKAAHLDAMRAHGRKVLMVGDGLNDTPALAAAHVSMSPAGGADVAQVSADFVFQGALLAPVADAIEIARRARTLARQNLWLALGYNVVAVPLAVAGLVTPVLAAALMSSSSIVVVLNALRARGRR